MAYNVLAKKKKTPMGEINGENTFVTNNTKQAGASAHYSHENISSGQVIVNHIPISPDMHCH